MATRVNGYNGNINLPKANTKIEWTPEKIMEYKKCMDDPVYFAEKYFKIIHVDEGLIPFKLYDFQKKVIRDSTTNNRILLAATRQCGKTSVYTVIALHFALFNKNKMVGILANKEGTAIEILERIQRAYEYLPDFLKGGVIEFNKKSMEFDNGSKIIASASSSSNLRGRSLSMIVLDEAAFIHNYFQFSASILPTISSGKTTKLLIASTPNGLNSFYEYVRDAREGKNDFVLTEVPWTAIPGRDEEWKKRTLAELNNDLDRFEQEYNVGFLGSSGTLLNGATLKALKKVEPLSTKDGLSIYHPKVDNRLYAMTCDVSHGKGLDYSAFHVIDVSEQPYKQVCTYRSNTVSPQDYAQIIFNIGKYYNNAFVLVENNDIGGTVTHILWHELEYDNLLSSQNNGRAGKKLVIGVPSKSDIGIRMTKSVKSLGCTVLKLIAESRQLEIVDKETIGELSTFSKKGSSYEAEDGKHDDCVMPLVSFAWMTTTDLFKELTDSNIMGTITDYSENQLANNLLSIGVVVTGVEDAEEKAYVRLEGDPDLWTEHDWNGYGNFSVM